MRFQIASDFHIEKNNNNINISELIQPSAPYLILAGDVGSLYKYDQLKSFLEELCKLYVKVFYIPGNHEFYTIKGISGIPFYQLIMKLHSLEKHIDNLEIINRKIIKINKYWIIGCILWSHCPVDKEFPKYRVRIHGFFKDKYNRFNYEDINFIKLAINECHQNNCIPIVVTHYPPSIKLLNPKNIKKGFNYLYANDLDNILNGNKIPVWICGHTHWSFDMTSDKGTRLIGNQKGTNNDSKYQKNFIISFN